MATNLGIATAYGYAKSKGYTGTEEQFALLMASYATVAQDAVDAALAAETSKNAAAQSKSDAEAYSQGTRGGTPVSSTDPTYHNNAKYYAENTAEAISAAAAGVVDAILDDATAAKNAAVAAQEAAEDAQDAAEDAADDAAASAEAAATSAASITSATVLETQAIITEFWG